MKRFFLLVFLVAIAAISVSAQEEIKVKSFLPSVNDLTARTNVRKDIEGKPCAMIKVIIADKGVAFECGNLASMIVGEVEFHTNEYWVYLAAGAGGAKHLKVKHPKYHTIDVIFADYGFSTLEPQTTYTLILQKPKEVNIEYQYNRIGATLTSLAVPGLGQIAFKKSYSKGALMLVGEAVAISGIFVCNKESNNWKNKSDMAITAADKKDFMAKSDSWANARTICISAAAAVWVYNIIDVLFAKKKVDRRGGLSMLPYVDTDNNYGISMAFSF